MGVHGSAGAGGAATPSLNAAARLAAMSCCPPAPASPRPEREQARQPIRGGGPHHHATAHGQAAPQPGRPGLEQALRQRCEPCQQPQSPVRGGGGAAVATPVPGHAQSHVPARPVDPALVALTTMLGQASVPERAPSLLQRLTGQLATMLADGSRRLAALLPASMGDLLPTSLAEAARPGARADAQQAPVLTQQPPPPPGPTLTLDPRLGIIVAPDTAPSERPADPSGTGQPLDGAEGGDDSSALPTSWLPIVGGHLRRLRGGTGALVERIDALLDELGITRLQLLGLMIAAPLAVAFLIDVAASILDGLG